MRKTKNRLFLTLFLSLFALAASAFDFKDNEGKLCFRISEGNAIVTYFSMSETENAAHYDESGTWDSAYYIPSTVEHDGKTYNVVGIDDYAFAGCTSIARLVAGEGVTWIGSYAFKGCNNLWHIYLPQSIGRIGDYAFKGCSAVAHIETAMTSLPKMANPSTVFEDVPAEAYLIVPEANADLFKNAAGWNKFAGSMPVSRKKAYLCNVESGLYLDFGKSQWGVRAVLSEVGAEIEAIRMADGHMLISTPVPDVADHYLHAYGLDGADFVLRQSPYRIWVIEGEDGKFQFNNWKFYISYRQEERETPIEWIEDNGEKTMWKLVTKEERIKELTSSDNAEKNASFLIKNPNLNLVAEQEDGWYAEGAGEMVGYYGANYVNRAIEVFDKPFDFYQVITGLPNGWYKLSATAYYRNGSLEEALAKHKAGEESLNSVLYANNVSVPVQSIFEGAHEGEDTGWHWRSIGEGLVVPNSPGSGAAAMGEGWYRPQEILVKVTDGTLRVGVKNENHVGADWTAFDNFSLTYYGAEVAGNAFDFMDNEGKICYRISDGNAIVTYFNRNELVNSYHYSQSGTWYYIPSTVEHDGKTYNVVGIDDYAFAGCTTMARLVAGEGVTWIGSYAFKGCNNLWHIYLPQSIGRIGDYAFKGCSAVTHFEADMTSLPKMANPSTVFEDVPAEAYFIVPEASTDLFKNAAGWNKFAGSMPVSRKKAYLCNVESGLYLDFGKSQWGNRAVLSEVGAEIEAIRMADGHMLISTPVQDAANHYLMSYGLDGADFILTGDPSLRIWVIEGEDGQLQLNTWKFYMSYRQEERETPIEWIEDNGEKTMWKLVTKEERFNQLTSSDNVEKNASFLIKNPNLNLVAEQEDGWHAEGAGEMVGYYGANNVNRAKEVFDKPFDFYQVITGLPNGWYKLSATAYYRNGSLEEALAKHKAGEESLNSVLYANNVSVPVQSIFEGAHEGEDTGWHWRSIGEGLVVPNSPGSGAAAMGEGWYLPQEILVKVTDGTLRVGVKNENHVGADWTAFDDFTLTYINKIVGDVNADGHVTISDAVALIDYCLSGKTKSLDAAVCDVDGNGVIDQNDANAIVKLFLNGK